MDATSLRPKFSQCSTVQAYPQSQHISKQSVLDSEKKLSENKWSKSVNQFYDQIINDPLLSKLFNDQILNKLPGKSNQKLLGLTVLQAMSKINEIINTAPKFENNSLDGTPFYSLFLDYLHTSEGQSFFLNYKVNANLKNIFNDYSRMLSSQKSLQFIDTWISGDALKYWDPSQFSINETHKTFGFSCWHDFFLRNFKPQARPIDSDPNVVTNACQNFPQEIPSMPVRNIKLKDDFWIKNNSYSLIEMVKPQLLENPQDIQLFNGGTIYQGFLSKWNYHKWHSPVDGKVLDSYLISGSYYAKNPQAKVREGMKDGLIKSHPYLSCTSTRHIFLIKSDNQQIGKIFLVFVGQIQISTCYTCKKKGDFVKKGQLIGQFRFGGSSHCIIFNYHCKLDFSSLQDQLKNQKYLTQQPYPISRVRLKVGSKLAKIRQ